MVLETFQKAGGYILGFRVDPQERIGEIFQELHSLYQVYFAKPNFGVDFSLEEEAPSVENLVQPRVDEDIEIIEDQEDTHAIAAYYADHNMDDESRFGRIQFDSKIGLAVEGLAEGLTLEQLWRVI